MSNKEFIQRVKQNILSIDESATIILFGSRARGDAKKDSDWDFLIITDNPVDKKKKESFRDKLVLTEIDSEQTINTLIYSKKTWNNYKVTPLYYFIKKEGIIL